MKLLVGGSSSKLFHLKEFAGNLEKKGIECKVVFDSDYADGFQNRKISKWFSSNKKYRKLINQFEPELGDRYMMHPKFGLHRLRFIKDE